jgi:hypothetical protein
LVYCKELWFFPVNIEFIFAVFDSAWDICDERGCGYNLEVQNKYGYNEEKERG